MRLFLSPFVDLFLFHANSCLILFSGDSLNSSLVAIVSVEQEVLKAWAASEGIKVETFIIFPSFFSCFPENTVYSFSLLIGVLLAELVTLL